MGFTQSKADYSLFTRQQNQSFITLLVYADDVLITSNDKEEVNQYKLLLGQKFKFKDFGELKFFIGLKVARSNKGIVLYQRKYELEVFNDVRLLGCKPVKTPMEESFRLSKHEGDILKDPSAYRRLIGRLLYLTITSHVITFAIQRLSQYMAKPRKPHLIAAQRILRYLKGELGKVIFSSSTAELHVKGFTDLDWASCLDARRTIIGYCIFIGDSLVSM